MRSPFENKTLIVSTALAAILLSAPEVPALQVPQPSARFADRLVADPTGGLDVASTPLASVPAATSLRTGWDAFRAAHGPDWSITLDRRSGAPLLIEGKGIPWPAARDASIDTLAASLREFAAANRPLLLADDAELVLNRDASGALDQDVWLVVFDRAIAGVPVAGERYRFTIGHGNLIAFGASRWSAIDASPVPDVDAARAQALLAAHMGLTADDAFAPIGKPALQLIPLRAETRTLASAGKYRGAPGAGYASALVWRIALRSASEPGTWVGLVDAHTGAIRSFGDDTRYARVKGGVYPISDDQICPDGCEQAGFPMPFAKVTIGTAVQTASALGLFTCSPGGSAATTTLAGQYVRVIDTCGPISESVTCNADVDLKTSAGIDCAVPDGASAGNTHAARSSYYHLNRIAEHARSWLPSRTWLSSQLTDRVNINQTCNAYWDGAAVNFFKSGGSCNNTGEIAGIFLHEWGHGLDQNDGGGFDNPGEAYADITAFMSTHTSCIGRGFLRFGNCHGYGDTCLNCTGVRDQDWDQRAEHVPSTPAGFLVQHCSGGGGPCGKEEHCEAYVSAEALWDLATRDLPAMGLDPASAWQVADKLWYVSRLGSGSDAYNCALPDSDGCAATSWFSELRVADDDDGDLANGTPHAAAIFAAFDRHKIACGAAADPANQNSSTCPPVGATTLTAIAGPTSAALSWTPVANSIGFRILRNDSGCQAAMTRQSLITGGSFTDNGLINGFPLYYSVQAIAANSACDGPLSSCVAVTPQSGAGTIRLDASSYGCTDRVNVSVTDGNVGANTTTVAFSSNVETQTETVTLTRVAPGSATYAGSIALTAGPAAHDGVLSVGSAGTITARYADANDGAGHTNQQRFATAASVCAAAAAAKPVPDGSFGTSMKGSRGDPAGSTIELTWDVATCASADHHVLYGDLSSVASVTVLGAMCDLGTTGVATWASVPAGDLWFVVVGDDNAAVEGSWGTDSGGAQRGGGTASGQCALSSRDNSGTCP